MAQINAGRVRFVSRGEYNNSTQYYTLDLVNYNGSSYYAKENVVGVLPTDNTKWQLVAEKGSIGSTGPTGPSGFSPIANVTQLTNGALISITDENGTTNANISNGEVTNKEFEYYKTISNVLPKVEDEDTEITLNNTGNAPLNIGLKGNTYQDSTTGKNLMLNTATTQTLNGITFNKNEDGTINVNGTATAQTYYYITDIIDNKFNGKMLTGCPSNGAWNTYRLFSDNLSDESSFISNSNDYGSGVTLPDTPKIRFMILIANGITINNLVFKPMVSDNGGDYEPYTNGAAPNPEFPMDIHVVSGNNTITISNSDDTEEQVYPINLGNIELCKTTDGKYEDYFLKNSNKWYKYGAIGKFTLSQFSDENKIVNVTEFQSNFNATNGIISLRISKNVFADFNINNIVFSNCFSNKFRANSGGWNNTNSLHTFSNVDGLTFWITYNEIGLSEWTKSSISNSIIGEYLGDVLFYLPLATPEITEITDSNLISQLDAIEYAMSYKEQTNISQENNDMPFVITASAFKDLSNL